MQTEQCPRKSEDSRGHRFLNSGSILEIHLQPELELARIARGTRSAASGGTNENCSTGNASASSELIINGTGKELRVVEDVERLSTELDIATFFAIDIEVLNQGEIALIARRQPENRAA